ncbi:transport-associated protein [Rhizobium leguminosarum]|uniref:transport-associated protein n=1 Tax=Rhizobium leguminosarum TaxID=384 RepID=UPI00144269C1|nr:transport-associated protein [Rhizobium leguminosarum]MBY5839755.1 transport-associated protein [Rhizobium leguminosarum]NKM79436.1 transport-associated protein [Rhizobium leguminosarum bv. viciae]QSZ09468.1 transport-associated protein [Rhizobium leguminosarum]
MGQPWPFCNFLERKQTSLSTLSICVPDIDSSAIEIRMLGPVVLLECFITKAVDRDKAISLAAMIVGEENVQDRMLSRFPTQ